MKLGFLLLADASESINGKAYVLGGGWNQLRFPGLPQTWNVNAVLGIDVAWDETNQRHTFEIAIEDPDGNPVAEAVSGEFETGRPPGMPPGQDQRFVISLTSACTFEAAGPHAMIVRIDGDEVDRTRFYVTPVAGADPPGVA